MDFKNDFEHEIDEVEESQNRLLHIYYADKWLRKVHVLDSDKSTLLYDVETNRLKRPDMIIRSAMTNETIGTVKIHAFRTRIETCIHDQDIELSMGSWMKGDYSYESRVLHNAKMTWETQRKLQPLDMVLLDDKAMPVCKFIPVGLTMKKAGKIELLGEVTRDPRMLDEIVVTALAIMQYRHIQQRGVMAATAANA